MRTNMYSVLYYVYVIATLFGMAPYSIKVVKGRLSAVPVKISILHILVVISIIVSMITFKFLYEYERTPRNTGELILQLSGNAKIVSAIATTVLTWYYRVDLVLAFDKIIHFDYCMHKIESRPNMHFALSYLQIACSVTIMLFFPICSAFMAYFYDHQSMRLIAYEWSSVGLQCIIHSFVAVYLNMYLLILYVRFHYLHITLEKFTDLKGNLKSEPISTLNYVCVMYEDLCNGAAHLNNVFSFSLFYIILFNILETLLIVYIVMINKIRDEKVLLYGAYNMTLVILVLFPAGIVQRKARGLGKYLSESTICYKNETALNIRTAFMLQTLQHEINFNACDCFPLSMATFVDQLGTSISFLLFFYQIANLNKVEE